MGKYTIKLTHDSAKMDRIHFVCSVETGECVYADTNEDGTMVIKGNPIEGVKVIDMSTIEFESVSKFKVLVAAHGDWYREDETINLKVTTVSDKEGVIYSCKYKFKPCGDDSALEVLFVEKDRLTYVNKEVLFHHLE